MNERWTSPHYVRLVTQGIYIPDTIERWYARNCVWLHWLWPGGEKCETSLYPCRDMGETSPEGHYPERT